MLRIALHYACSCSGFSNEGLPVGHVTNCDLAYAFVRMYLGADAVQPLQPLQRAVMIVVVATHPWICLQKCWVDVAFALAPIIDRLLQVSPSLRSSAMQTASSWS